MSRFGRCSYLARYTGLPRTHTESDLRVFLRWCVERGLDPLAAQRLRPSCSWRCICRNDISSPADSRMHCPDA